MLDFLEWRKPTCLKKVYEQTMEAPQEPRLAYMHQNIKREPIRRVEVVALNMMEVGEFRLKKMLCACKDECGETCFVDPTISLIADGDKVIAYKKMKTGNAYAIRNWYAFIDERGSLHMMH